MNDRGDSTNQRDMSRVVLRGFQHVIDLLVLSAAYWAAFALRFEFSFTLETYKLLLFTWPYVLLLKFGILLAFGVPNLAWRYIGLRELARIVMALGVATAGLVALRIIGPVLGGYFKFITIPFGVSGIDLALAVLGVSGVRVSRRVLAERQERRSRACDGTEKRRSLLIGAGRAGVMVAKEVEQNPQMGIEVVGFVDDDPLKVGSVIQGHKVLGDSASIARIAAERGAQQAIITIASASGATIRKIVAGCEKAGLPVRIIPGIYEILQGKVGITRIREVTIEDLLGREAVELDLEAIGRFLCGKRVLVTGAGGSIGSELCRQVARFDPDQLILLEQAENPLFEIDSELRREHPNIDAAPVIADICDSHRVDLVFSRFRPQVVFHAAAHKHVPMMEWNPGEALKNNVFGTKKVADAADRFGTEAFVMISTDKAVNPTSIMGASKRVAEIYVQALARRSKTKYVAVRFGNVLGSAGSVIPTFKEQIRRGGPVTVTHQEMKRYFMTIPEACQLVMEAATMGLGGEIFVLDMGEPVRIADLARDLIRLSGLAPDRDIPIRIIGRRAGEKLQEELLTESEAAGARKLGPFYMAQCLPIALPTLLAHVAQLRVAAERGQDHQVVEALQRLVPTLGDGVAATHRGQARLF